MTTRTTKGGRFLRRALDRLTSSTGALEADEIRGHREAEGCDPVASCADRDMVRLHGSLNAVTLRPHGAVCALEAELFDGSGTVTLVWLGRRHINGVDPGRSMTVHGRISCHDGIRIMYNPRYELSA